MASPAVAYVRERRKPTSRLSSKMFAIALLLSFVVSIPLSTALPRNEFQWIQVKGSSIVREDGTPVTLRGANLPPLLTSRTAFASYSFFLTAAKSMGFNLVRLPISWAELEPRFGEISARYIDLIRRIVRLAEEIEIYLVLDMHQYEMDGFPSWAVDKLGNPKEMAQVFWNDSLMQSKLAQAWMTLASALREEKAIFAYDLLNEPYGGMIAWNRFAAIIRDFYTYLISEVRSVDPKHTILFEPIDVCACTAIFGNQVALRPQGVNLVFSPHLYIRGSAKDLTFYVAGVHNLAVNVWGIPLWIGEFGGVDVELGDQNSMNRLNTTLNLFAQYKLGWAYWVVAETGTGPQPVDAHGRASSLLSSVLANAVNLILTVGNASSPVERTTDANKPLPALGLTTPALNGLLLVGVLTGVMIAFPLLLVRSLRRKL